MVEVLDRVVRWHPQKDYSGLKKSHHKEWAFIHRVTLYIGEAFLPVEEALENPSS